MRPLAPILGALAFLLAASCARAETSPEAAALRQELAAKVPPAWQLHVTWRGQVLVAFVTPPYQQAFDLWYDPQKLHAAMLGLCPAPDDPIWRRIGPGREVALVPTVGGKTADAMRVTCPRDATRPPA